MYDPSSSRPLSRREPSSLRAGTWRPSLVTHWFDSAARAVVAAPFRRITLAITEKPCMSIPAAPPRIRSMRSTWLAGTRTRMALRSSVLDPGRAPSISTLPADPSNPRTELPPLKAKPGRREIMSPALAGPWAAK